MRSTYFSTIILKDQIRSKSPLTEAIRVNSEHGECSSDEDLRTRAFFYNHFWYPAEVHFAL